MQKQPNGGLYESRSAHRNIAVKHPARWRLLAEWLLAPAARLHRYRDLNRRTVESALEDRDCRLMCR